jgi:2-keto-3-deoxy-L-rhamnonate aldolase RhmA
VFRDIDTFRRKLVDGHPCLGPSISFADPAVTESLADSVDFIWIDLEHTALNLETLQAHLIAARAGEVPALVRIPRSDETWIKRVLDMGAEGIICPQIDGAEEARRFVAACHYPPKGTRGFGPRRPSNYGRRVEQADRNSAEEKLFVVVQIERRKAVDELQEILSLPGLSSIVIGPYDLSASYGKLGQLRDSAFRSTIKQIVEQTRGAGLPVGMAMGLDVEMAREAFDLGVNWIQFGADFNYLHSRADQMFERIRAQ